MIDNDDMPRVGRAAGAWHVLHRMKSREAVKWSALSLGGSVGLVASLIAIETLVRWIMAVLDVCAPLVRWVIGA